MFLLDVTLSARISTKKKKGKSFAQSFLSTHCAAAILDFINIFRVPEFLFPKRCGCGENSVLCTQATGIEMR